MKANRRAVQRGGVRIKFSCRRLGPRRKASPLRAGQANASLRIAIRLRLKQASLRVEVDASSDRMGNKIRKAQEQKIPYMLVVGDKEVEAETVAVRLRTNENLGPKPVEEFIRLAQEAVADKRDL